MSILDKLIAERRLTPGEWKDLLRYAHNIPLDDLCAEAVRIRKAHYDNVVYLRGLIEISNICKNDCYYCGIRCSNSSAIRYRLTPEVILRCCEEGEKLGYRTFVLQGGEDPWFNSERMAEIIQTIKEEFPHCAVTLSLGEHSRETYSAYRNSGADRYLLRHETANDDHYSYLHPKEMTLENRMRCLNDLKDLGFMVGCGFMVGSPRQSFDTLCEDFLFMQELQPHMVGIGPFLPHKSTPFKAESPGSAEQTLRCLAITRMLLPDVLLPATTALGTVDGGGYERGIQAGANVIMLNLTPETNRKHYLLYDNKDGTAANERRSIERRMERIGYRIEDVRGDHPSFTKSRWCRHELSRANFEMLFRQARRKNDALPAGMRILTTKHGEKTAKMRRVNTRDDII